jgi:hypothetical protein
MIAGFASSQRRITPAPLSVCIPSIGGESPVS